MKKDFYFGLIGLLLFEFLNVYFIMPFPGSQRMNTLALAYYLYTCRWAFRIIFGAVLLISFFKTSWKHRWVPILAVLTVAGILYVVVFKMPADHLFLKTKAFVMADPSENKVDSSRMIIGVYYNGEARAYPIQYIGYHHQVQDYVGGNPVLVTYCTVCHTGRVFQPMVRGKLETFRLVGMDHFNAMFEDATTHSWWRQATGEAVAGPLTGAELQEITNTQTTLGQWLKMYPNSKIMQVDPLFSRQYGNLENYESGKSKSSLTGRDSLPWHDKSWIIGVKINDESKAYDWNELKAKRLIHDQLSGRCILVVMGLDNKSFFTLERVKSNDLFSIKKDTLFCNGFRYSIDGRAIDSMPNLNRIPCYQEYWHSWHTFHPETDALGLTLTSD